jgi:hypothetical protein
MDGTNIQHYFEKLDRGLKRLGIVLVDDFEEVKKGVAAPIVALVRKLLFNTSTIVMKYMLLRGCPSHVSDKKVAIALFDLLRETVKYSPPISIDQFFTSGFGQHKIVILTKLSEYVAHIDRMAGRSGTKTAFVVHNEVVQQAAASSSSSSSTNLIATNATADDEPSQSPGYHDDPDTAALAASLSSPLPMPPSKTTSPSPVGTRGSMRSPTASTTTLGMKQTSTSSGDAPGSHSVQLGQRRSLSSQRAGATLRQQQQSTAAAASSSSSSSSSSMAVASPSTPISQLVGKDTAEWLDHNGQDAVGVQDHARYMKEEDVQKLIDAKVQEKLQQTVAQISEKYDFVINKLVAAVDAEFTLLGNRIKALEHALSLQSDAPIAAAASSMTSSDEPHHISVNGGANNHLHHAAEDL